MQVTWWMPSIFIAGTLARQHPEDSGGRQRLVPGEVGRIRDQAVAAGPQSLAVAVEAREAEPGHAALEAAAERTGAPPRVQFRERDRDLRVLAQPDAHLRSV